MEAMQEDRSEKCALLGGDSDLEYERQGNAALANHRKQGCFGLSSDGTPCPAPRHLWPCSLAVLIITMLAFLTVAHLETCGRMEKLQLELSELRRTAFGAGLNKTEYETPGNAENDEKHPVDENPRTQQKLQTMESNMARMNQYLVSLKSSHDRLKTRVEKELSHTEMASLSTITLRVNETLAAHLISLRREMNHLNGAIANLTNRVLVLEENVPSQRQNRTASDAKKKKENQSSTFLDIPGNLDIKMTKEPDTEAFTDDEMGLLRSHPSSGHPRSTQGPSASPRPKGKEQDAPSEEEGDLTRHHGHNDGVLSLAHG